MSPAWPRNTRYGLSRRMRALTHCNVAKRENSNKTLVAIHHRQPTDLLLAHVPRDVLKTFVFEAVLDVRGHYLLDLVSGPFPLAIARTAMSRSVTIPTR
jgi:hypothetical protein